ncbi:MAG: c-type cytochrome [Rubrivivax sp.]|nr:c-type cytochrome [Rubrivivax sp.]
MAVERTGRALVWLAAAWLLGGAGAALAQPPARLLEQCAACHGPGGNAQVPQFPSLAGQPKLFIENQLVIIREGLRDIPSMAEVMKGMSDEDIVALARHFAAQPLQAKPAVVQAGSYQRGAELSRQLLCGTCHLPSYAGQQQVPRLAGQNEAYLLLSMKDFRDKPGPGRDTIMASTLRGLADGDLAQLAHYLANFKP